MMLKNHCTVVRRKPTWRIMWERASVETKKTAIPVRRRA